MANSIRIVSTLEPDTKDDFPSIGSKKAICNICVQKEARYTCPRCNISYCCLDCYRHKKHEGCSESFYREWVLDEMKEYAVRPEDREKVLEMLSREHKQQTSDSDDDDDDVPDLGQRLSGLDLDRDGVAVWQQLTVTEREEFAHMLKDGRLSALVTVWTPWWMTQTDSLVQETGGDHQLPDNFPPHVYDVPDIHVLFKGQPSANIRHNVVNVLAAYAFVTRMHNGDHHHCPLQATQELLTVCDVLQHNVNFSGPTEAVHAVLHQVHKADYVVGQSLAVTMVGDVIRILQGTRLSPLCAVLSALSDLTVLVRDACRELRQASGKTGTRRQRGQSLREEAEGGAWSEDDNLRRQLLLVKKKVQFLVSWAQRYGLCLAALCPWLTLELECLRSEAEETQGVQSAVEEGLRAGLLQPHTAHNTLEELS